MQTEDRFTSQPALVFWQDMPSHLDAGYVTYAARHWKGPVHCVYAQGCSPERQRMGWSPPDMGGVEPVVLSEQDVPRTFVREYIQHHRQAIHLMGGFRVHVEARKQLLRLPGARVAIGSERPYLYGSFVKKLLLPLLYRYYAGRYGKRIRAFLAMGTLGVDTFARFGWQRDILYPFMYQCPRVPDLPPTMAREPGAPLRLLFAGQFDRRKGIDLLMAALDLLPQESWHLDLVGKGGDWESQTLSWARRQPSAAYQGVWPAAEMARRATKYDVCLVPSRHDGWGMFTNEAIQAGVGVIVTDRTGSKDLVAASGAGLVVPANDVQTLRMAIERVANTPGLADAWKARAKSYAPRADLDVVGRYLLDVLEYAFCEKAKPRPVCPWL